MNNLFALELRKATVTTAPGGVPQVSVLGPISIYVQLIPSLLHPFIEYTILIADIDDVSFDCSRDFITDITCITQALRVLVPWCTECGLSVNMDKRYAMLIHLKGTPSA